jgi:DNA modification methylase
MTAIDVSSSGHYVGDCRELLKRLPDGCVQTCITSPPYWGLRDYGVNGQLGLEPTPEQFVASLVDVFREVRRALADDGTLWLNLGDCYITNPRGPGGAGTSTLTGTPDSERRRQRWSALPHPKDSFDPKVKGRSHSTSTSRGLRTSDLKHKDLVGIPWMVAFALRADGWYLRSDIIWAKPNPMPESVRDRPTKSHEYLFLLSKSASYFYDKDAVAEPSTWKGQNRSSRAPARSAMPGAPAHRGLRKDEPTGTRNRRSVWHVTTKPYKGAHFATFPPDLIEPCVLAGSRPGDVVLDPFFGSGTTGMVAAQHGRRWIGFDLNPAYEVLQRQRIGGAT